VSTHPSLVALPPDRGGDQPLFDPEQLRGGVAALLQRPLGHDTDRPLLKEPVGQRLELAAVGADELRTQRGDRVLPRERGCLRGQSLRAGELVERAADIRLGVRRGLVAIGRSSQHVAQQARDVGAVLASLGAPPLSQGGGRLVPLGLPGAVDRPLDQLRGAHPALALEPLDLQVDRVRPLGERPHQFLRDAGDLAVAVLVGLDPLDPQRPRQRALVGTPVDRIRRQPMPVQVATIQRGPATIRPLHPVRHDHVGVQQRVARPRRAVVEPDRDQLATSDMVVPAMAAAGADVRLEIAERLLGRLLVGVQHTGDLGVAQAVQQRHALGRAEHHIEGRHAPVTVGAAEQGAGVGVAAMEHVYERLGGGGAVLAKRGGALAEPAARGLAVAGEVLFAVVGDLAEIVVLAADRQLGDVHNHPCSPFTARS
jgi:hypothetical protein